MGALATFCGRVAEKAAKRNLRSVTLAVYLCSGIDSHLPPVSPSWTMALTACHKCGTPLPADARACSECGAPIPRPTAAAYRPIPPRPPEEPERPGWQTAAGWAAAVVVCGLFALFLFRASTSADRRATEKDEIAQEQEHL